MNTRKLKRIIVIAILITVGLLIFSFAKILVGHGFSSEEMLSERLQKQEQSKNAGPINKNKESEEALVGAHGNLEVTGDLYEKILQKSKQMLENHERYDELYKDSECEVKDSENGTVTAKVNDMYIVFNTENLDDIYPFMFIKKSEFTKEDKALIDPKGYGTFYKEDDNYCWVDK